MMNDQQKCIKRKTKDKIGIIILDNPPLNLLTEEIKSQLLYQLSEIEKNESIITLVMRSEGEKAFSAGRDLNESLEWIQSGLVDESVQQAWERGRELIDKIYSLPQITIATIEGVALGGGAEILLPFDIRIASKQAKIGFPEIKRGLFPGTGGMELLRNYLSDSKILELLTLGDSLSASECLNLGLVNRVTSSREAFNESMKIAENLTQYPRTTLRAIKKILRFYAKHTVNEARSFEKKCFKDIFTTMDAKEGIISFFEKRKPNFEHK